LPAGGARRSAEALPKTARRRRRLSPPPAAGNHPAVLAGAAVAARGARMPFPGGCAADGDELNEEIGE